MGSRVYPLCDIFIAHMGTSTQNTVLLDFEVRVDLGPTFAARLLGVAYPTYAQYRSGRRVLPDYHRNHIQALLALSPRALRTLIEEHANGGKTA